VVRAAFRVLLSRAAGGTGEAGWSGAGPHRSSERLAAEGAHSQPLVGGRERCAELGATVALVPRPADRYVGAPPRGVPAPAPRDVEEQLQDLRARLQAVLAELEACMQAGTLSLPDYVLQLRAKIRCDKQGAVAAKAAGRRLAAVRLLGHVKLMTKELAEAEASLPPAAAAESNSVSSAAPPSQQTGEKQYRSGTARSLQRMMTQFNRQVAQMDLTTQKQRCARAILYERAIHERARARARR
jgi:hypothetical protein